ncbi:alpha/beta fold hydrolase [Winogradskyella immobilis]|uniref:Alpha/beta fold hydrolase n=1 Tax=Winogradskyella immobilis TaxID=2816852 RepID=A0ABS8ENJ1_9FLAO|nr:alpha/beta fold hydrolase [Winogradskyella immobilis]MCC1483867.1 alpha/beta fold hydrolase [Winogradskyella immobilis]
MSDLLYIPIKDYVTHNGSCIKTINLSYQLFGNPLHTAPIVLVNHALTGNSNVAGKDGWWSSLIGDDKVINTKDFTVLVFNIPGNGYDGQLFNNYKDFVTTDIAKLFLQGLKHLKIEKLYATIGASLGGGLAWEMVALQPNITKYLIPIAADWKSTDWLIANCRIQEQFLENSKQPIHDARMHAMLCYRSPQSFKHKFNRSTNEDLQLFNVESWLLHHGKKLQGRFQLSAYKLMNQLLKTINIERDNDDITSVFKAIKGKIHLITIDSDVFFTSDETEETYSTLKSLGVDVHLNIIESYHGHDAFLIEYEKLNAILKPIFS